MIARILLLFLLIIAICNTKIYDVSVQGKGTVEEIPLSNLFMHIKENDTWMDVLDIHPGTHNGYKKVPYESSTSKDENGNTLYHTRIQIKSRDAPEPAVEAELAAEPVVESVPSTVEETPHSDVPITENNADSLPEVEATIEMQPSNRTEEFFPNPPAFTLSRLVRHAQ